MPTTTRTRDHWVVDVSNHGDKMCVSIHRSAGSGGEGWCRKARFVRGEKAVQRVTVRYVRICTRYNARAGVMAERFSTASPQLALRSGVLLDGQRS
jgi:hypothetical protein